MLKQATLRKLALWGWNSEPSPGFLEKYLAIKHLMDIRGMYALPSLGLNTAYLSGNQNIELHNDLLKKWKDSSVLSAAAHGGTLGAMQGGLLGSIVKTIHGGLMNVATETEAARRNFHNQAMNNTNVKPLTSADIAKEWQNTRLAAIEDSKAFQMLGKGAEGIGMKATGKGIYWDVPVIRSMFGYRMPYTAAEGFTKGLRSGLIFGGVYGVGNGLLQKAMANNLSNTAKQNAVNVYDQFPQVINLPFGHAYLAAKDFSKNKSYNLF